MLSMPNPTPKTDQIQPFQYERQGAEPRGRVIGTRYPLRVEAVLDNLPHGIDKQDFIRAAVAEKLHREQLL